ncbi:3-oxoacyl-ACP synthase [Hymenobacter sp. UV11]|uniref:3-oxoacyl-ACP synthase n=1 Tax=Hymenobacter sp. UV11 TaxID=1849735 RepID=UPI00105B4601|nr:3-oxoacyl-ACP synthase [Hymenobacter sp. UV11]TDN40097.1 3-oxoacyl-ACP synthase [Hymenobacter sp. UV11]TFZ63983.1 3-oxoacyl-ACP synthase [Hymenobacter sp. UV11]
MSPKPALHAACLAYVQLRLDAARAGMAAAQESSNSETKSSAGDKYETGRAMAQQERDRHAAQLHEAQQLLTMLQKINPELASKVVRPGALATTSLGLFYISIGAGKLTTAEGYEFMAVSPAAPLAEALSGKKAGEEVVFNGKKIKLAEVS